MVQRWPQQEEEREGKGEDEDPHRVRRKGMEVSVVGVRLLEEETGGGGWGKRGRGCPEMTNRYRHAIIGRSKYSPVCKKYSNCSPQRPDFLIHIHIATGRGGEEPSFPGKDPSGAFPVHIFQFKLSAI